MATVEITANVAVEKFVHNALRNLAQSVWEEHGICVQSVRFSWLEMSTLEKPELVVTDVEASTMTKV